MVHSELCLTHSIPLEIYKKQIQSYTVAACKHVYSYEVANLAYFERGGLGKQRSGPPRSSNSRETP